MKGLNYILDEDKEIIYILVNKNNKQFVIIRL